jgi:hypothetical protein
MKNAENRKLMKTGKEIKTEHHEIEWNIHLYSGNKNREIEEHFDNQKYLILPDGLDALEKMLKDDALLHYNVAVSYDVVKNISSVFAQFKKQMEVSNSSQS